MRRSFQTRSTQRLKDTRSQWSIINILMCMLSMCGCGGIIDSSDQSMKPSHQYQSEIQPNTSLTTKDRGQKKPDQIHQPQDKMTKTLRQSGEAQVGKHMPFFSGWLTTGQVINLTGLLQQNRARYVITMCASWCEPCFEGLALLSEAKDKFLRSNTALLIYVIDTEVEAKKIQKRFNFNWAQVLSDQFKSYARKLSSSENNTLKEAMELPRTFVLDKSGTIEMIIGQEGHDYINLLLGEGE